MAPTFELNLAALSATCNPSKQKAAAFGKMNSTSAVLQSQGQSEATRSSRSLYLHFLGHEFDRAQ